MKNIKAIIFDSDGVVTSSKMFSEELTKQYGIKPESLGSFFKNEFQDCLIGKKDLKREISFYLNDWGWSDTVDALLEFWFVVEDEKNENLIRDIKILHENGIKCYLGTNQEKYRTEYMKQKMGFNNLFDTIFSSASLGVKKPDVVFLKKIFEQISRDHNLEKDEVMFWDDDKENVVSAEQFGIKSYLYNDYESFKKRLEIDVL